MAEGDQAAEKERLKRILLERTLLTEKDAEDAAEVWTSPSARGNFAESVVAFDSGIDLLTEEELFEAFKEFHPEEVARRRAASWADSLRKVRAELG